MTYLECFVTPVPTAKKDAYVASAKQFAPMVAKLGVIHHAEAWADDVPDGKITDFRKSVQAQDDESVAIGWLEYPDRATRNAANAAMGDNPEMAAIEVPFDGKRMIFGGFEVFVDEGETGVPGYTDGFVVPVHEAKKEAYRELAQSSALNFRKNGALRVVEAWGDDVPDGKITDYRRAVKAEPGESIVYSFIAWPDKATRDKAWEAIMADPEMQPSGDMPFDGKRMFWGGFVPVFIR